MSDTVRAVCRECGMTCRVIFKTSIIETIASNTIAKCHRGLEGLAVVNCPSIEQEIAAVLRTQIAWEGLARKNPSRQPADRRGPLRANPHALPNLLQTRMNVAVPNKMQPNWKEQPMQMSLAGKRWH